MSKLSVFKRILKSGYLSFRRNDWLSMATIMIMTIALFIMGNMIFLGAFASTVLNGFESKIDVSVYFKQEATEDDIATIIKDVKSLPDVAEIRYVTKEDALARFKDLHKDNALILTALDEIGDNPLQASMNIRAQDPTKYGSISEFLRNKKYPMLDKINYFENQEVINRFGSILATVRGTGALALVILAFITILVTFNTIRLAIYTMREEVGIMRLVGASAWFVRGPFLVAGVLYGLIAAVAVMAVFFPITWAASPKLAILVPQFNLFAYFLNNFFLLLGVMSAVGILLGVFSSFIAIRKYLKV